MALENANLEDSNEFEPDSNFFDNFLDGMDVLIDNCRNSKDEQSWMDEESDCSSGADRMVIDLPSSPESRNTKEVKNDERSDIKDVLTNRVLAQLENSSYRRDKVKNSFPSSQLVVDVLDRLKKSVQQKTNPSLPSSSTTLHADTSKKNHSIPLPVPRAGDGALQVKLQGAGILSTASTDPDEQNRKQNKTMSQLFRWIFGENTLRHEHAQSVTSRGANLHEDKNLDLNRPKDKRKRRKHKKHKSRNKEHSRRHRHHKTKSNKKRRLATYVEEAKTSDFSLESVSSENEDDILNKRHSDEERVPLNGKVDGMARPDCEEGEVLSSSSDWESECVAKKRRDDLNSHQVRPDCLSPSLTDGPWSRRFQQRRTPPSPSWRGMRHTLEDHERYILRRTRSPARMSPWREQPSDRQHVRIPIPRLGSLPPVPIALPLRPRSPGDRLANEMPRPLVDSFGYPTEPLTSRRVDYVLHPFHRPRSPWEEVHESQHLFKSFAPIEVHAREVPVPCPPLMMERRFSKEPDISDRRKRPGLLLRCLQEIRHRSYKPGRFVYDPKLEVLNATPSSCPIGRYSSPLYSSYSRTRALSFTTPNVRHIVTSSSFLGQTLSAVSVGCQTQREEILNITGKQVEKSADPNHRVGSKHLPVFSEIAGKSLLTVRSPETACANAPSSAVSGVADVASRSHDIYRTLAQSNRERQDIIQEIVSQVSVSKTTSYPTSSQGTLEMWKTIVSYRYPDLSEKEREQVVLVKSMETETKHETETA